MNGANLASSLLTNNFGDRLLVFGFICIDMSRINAAAIIDSSNLPYINPITNIPPIANMVIIVFLSS